MSADAVSQGRTWYRSHDWDGWRVRFWNEDGGPYVVCEYGFGWCGRWLAGPFETFADADAAREPARRRYPAGAVTPAVVAVRPSGHSAFCGQDGGGICTCDNYGKGC